MWPVFALAMLHVYMCPFTKVEESFNMQAMHDFEFILNFDLSGFDHFDFPGVVPRTFIGASVVSILSWPLIKLLPSADVGMSALYISRIILAFIICCSLSILQRSLTRNFGTRTGTWFSVACCSQFHLLFYMGRPLPNTYALGLCSLALAKWIDKQWAPAIFYLVFCTVVFRCDTLILTGIVSLMMMVQRETTLVSMIINGFSSGLCSLFFTLAFDSVCWRKLVWPEGMVLFFNTIMNKSSEWGTMPYHWYFTRALPKSLLATFPLALLSIFKPFEASIDVRTMYYFVLPSILYVAVYSILPHKEVRFLFQVFPFLTCAAACTIDKLERYYDWGNVDSSKGKRRSKFQKAFARLTHVCIWGAMLGSFLISSVFLLISSHNYPGGYALQELQSYHLKKNTSSSVVHAHYCTYAAMSGITRFGEEFSKGTIVFSKQEDEPFLNALCDTKPFQYLIMETSRYQSEVSCENHYRIVKEVEGEPRLNWTTRDGNKGINWFPRIETRPVLYVLERNE